MRVLHMVSIATMTGPADPALNLAAAQRRKLGYDARIAYDDTRPGDMGRRVVEYDVPTVTELHPASKGGLINAIRDRRTLREIEGRFDLIHVHASHDHSVAALAGLSTPLVRSIHHPRSIHRRVFQGFNYRRTNAFVFVSQAHREAFGDAYPDLRDRARVVVPGAVDTDRFNPRVSPTTLREEFEIPTDACLIGMVARFSEGRGQDLLLRAFRHAVDLCSRQLHLALIGKGETQGYVKALVRDLGLADRVVFCGFRDADLPEAFRACDATVILREGNDASCRAVLQSMACAVPVIAADYPAIADAIDPQKNGWLVPVDAPEPLSEAIQRVAALSGAELKAVGGAARRTVEHAHTEGQRARRVHRLYETLVMPHA